MTIGELKRNNHYKEYINTSSQHIFILTPPGNDGIESAFMQTLFEALQKTGSSVVMFNFSCRVLGREVSDELKTEVAELWEVYKEMSRKYPTKKIHLVGKSLGGIVSSLLISTYSAVAESISILGYVPGRVVLGDYSKKVFVVQGEDDVLGSIQKVLGSLKDLNANHYLKSIKCAGHSFKCTADKTKNHNNEAIDELLLMMHTHIYLKPPEKRSFLVNTF